MPGKANTKAQNRKSRRNNMPRRPRQNTTKGRNNGWALTYSPPLGNHTPLPQAFFTRLTASGSFYTGVGVGTGANTWNFKMNSIAFPFNSVTTGVTWNNLTPALYLAPGSTFLMSATGYQRYIVYSSMIEIDATPQSVTDSIIVTITPSENASVPGSIGLAAGKPFTRQMTFASGRTYRQRDFPMYMRFSPWKLVGLPKYLYMNDTSGNFVGTYSGGTFNNPSSSYSYVVNMATGDFTNYGQAVEVRVRMTYFVKFYGLATEALVLNNAPEQKEELRRPKHREVPDHNPCKWHFPRVMSLEEPEDSGFDEVAFHATLNEQRPMQQLDDPACRPLLKDPLPALEQEMSKLLEEPVVIKAAVKACNCT